MLLDASGLPVRDTEEVWRVQALCEWLADARVVKRALRRGVLTPARLKPLAIGLAVELKTRHEAQHSPVAPPVQRVDREFIKRVMLSMLSDPVVRRAIAAAMWRSGEFSWPDQRQIRRDLQTEREELEVEMASRNLVWRPES